MKLAGIILAGLAFASPALAMPPVPEGVNVTRMTFDDEFNTFNSSSSGLRGWMTRYPYEGRAARALPELDGNREAEFYSDASVGHNPFSVKNGILSITAQPADPYSNPYGMPYTSGLITTHGSFAQTFGYFEMRAKLPAGKGLWNCFWLLPVDFKDYHSELDIFEILGDKPNLLHFSTHHQPDFADKKWLTDMKHLTIEDSSDGFHTYGVDWEPETVTLFIDGKSIATSPTPPHMDYPMYILINIAVGGKGSWPGQPDASTKFPAVMQVDYVRAFATKNTHNIRGTAVIP